MPEGSQIPTPDRGIADAFVKKLTGAANGVMRLRFVHDRDRSQPAYEREGPLAQWWQEIVDFQRQGYGVFYFVNEIKRGPGSGFGGCATDADTQRIRFLCGDFDTGLLDELSYHSQPAVLVNSSTKEGVQRGQVLWPVTDCSAASFKGAQERLVGHYGIDSSVTNPSRVLRMPGTLHLKREPQLVTFIDSIGTPMTVAELTAALRPLAAGKKPQQKNDAAEDSEDSPTAGIDRVISRRHLKKVLEHVRVPRDRATWRNHVASIRATPLADDSDHADALEIAKWWSQRDGYPYGGEDEEELERIWRTMPPRDGGRGYGSLWQAARENGFRGPPAQEPIETAFTGMAGMFEDEEEPEPNPAGIDDDDEPEWQKDGRRFLRTGSFDINHDPNDEPADFMEYMGEEEPERLPMLVDGYIEAGLFVPLVGIGGSHKSRLVQQICLSLIYWRQPFRPKFRASDDHTVAVTHVEILSYENSKAETKRRFYQMRKKTGIGPNEATPSGATMKIWELRKSRTPILVVSEQGIVLTKFGYRVLTRLEKIPGHKVLWADSFFNAIRFNGRAKVFDDRAKAAVETLDHWCELINLTILSPFHPSRAGADKRRQDSGYSPEFENSPREVLGIRKADPKDIDGGSIEADSFALEIKKWNGGKQGRKLVLVYDEGCLIDRGDGPVGASMSTVDAAAEIIEMTERDGKKLQRGQNPNTEEGALRQHGTGEKDPKTGRRASGPVEKRTLDTYKVWTGVTEKPAQSLRRNADTVVEIGKASYDDSGKNRVAGYSGVKPPPNEAPGDDDEMAEPARN